MESSGDALSQGLGITRPVTETSMAATPVVPLPAVAARLVKPLSLDAQPAPRTKQPLEPRIGQQQTRRHDYSGAATFAVAGTLACCAALCALCMARAKLHRGSAPRGRESDSMLWKFSPSGRTASIVRYQALLLCLMGVLESVCQSSSDHFKYIPFLSFNLDMDVVCAPVLKQYVHHALHNGSFCHA